MALAEKTALPQQPQRRIWKRPKTRARWIWLLISVLLYGGVSYWYFNARKTALYASPLLAPFWIFGLISFSMVLLVAAYSLRRRFVRVLPGRVEDWLWLHTWFGITSLLIAFEHEAYLDFFGTFRFTFSEFIRAGFGVSALYGLILLVVSGILGRLLDVWQARVIATEASRNGVGIIQAVAERLHEQDLLLERLSAGKSSAFKEFCTQALQRRRIPPQPALVPQELEDLQRVLVVLGLRVRLMHSLQRQQRARFIIKSWRSMHIALACVALGVISVHSLFESAKLLLQFLLHR
jgi:hypothetical protein